MPSASCAGAERSLRIDVDAHHCSPHVRKPNCGVGGAADGDQRRADDHRRLLAWLHAQAAGRPGARAREDIAAYRGLGGYRPLAGADELLERGRVQRAARSRRRGLSARGEVARGARQRCPPPVGTVVVANGEEGEPASIKDRWLLRNRPHLILDGLRLAAAIVAADRAYVYVSDPESARSVETALAELGADALGGIAVELCDGANPDTSPARRPPPSARSTAARSSRRTSRRARSRWASTSAPRW